MGKKTESGKKNTKNFILNILIAIFILIAIICAVLIFWYFHAINSSKQAFTELKDEIDEDYVDEDGEEIFEEVDSKQIFKKYSSLYNKNSDFIGWLSIAGTEIDYPVMQTPDDEEYYLHRNFDKEYSYAGTLFIDASCRAIGDTTDNIIIYGHNMKAGTMFHELLNYEDEDFYNEHKYITFDTIEGEGTYVVIAAFRTRVYSEDDTENYNFYNFISAESEEEFNEYVNNAKKGTAYTISESADYGEQLLTLSTCAYHTNEGRFVVVAKKVEE